MITTLPPITGYTGVSYPQQQASTQQAATDIRTNNAQQVEKRNVEPNAKAPTVLPKEDKALEDRKKRLEQPRRSAAFDQAIEQRQKKASRTQSEVARFLLDAATIASPAPAPGISNAPESQSGSRVDVVV